MIKKIIHWLKSEHGVLGVLGWEIAFLSILCISLFITYAKWVAVSK